ncbi:RHS repeat domain-containing protein [Frankia tisae]|uniref:RHS repeat domain-containing protein n=1 Tax=Frankia tisae TaxID=2950104 RepID=UPI0021C0CD30|nr:RHS repeat domain-containing protein [Frankia tisae]
MRNVDASTGLPTTTTVDSVTLTTGYDSWGQVTSQTDADGKTAATTYDVDGRIATVNDGKGTYTYDGGSGGAPWSVDESRCRRR